MSERITEDWAAAARADSKRAHGSGWRQHEVAEHLHAPVPAAPEFQQRTFERCLLGRPATVIGQMRGQISVYPVSRPGNFLARYSAACLTRSPSIYHACSARGQRKCNALRYSGRCREMEMVDGWTGRTACALQAALRMSNDEVRRASGDRGAHCRFLASKAGTAAAAEDAAGS